MNIKELRKKYPAPFALSVLQRAIEIDQDDPNVAKASREYIASLQNHQTPCDWYYVELLADKLKTIRISTEVYAARKDVERLAWHAMSDDVDEQLLNETIAKLGEKIEIHPVREIELSGNVTGFMQKGNYVAVIGLDVTPVAKDKELFASLLNTMEKNAISAYMQYMYQKEKGGKVPVTFEEFFLNMRIQFYDSLMERPICSFQSEIRTMENYLSVATKMLAENNRWRKFEISLVQCQVIDLSK